MYENTFNFTNSNFVVKLFVRVLPAFASKN